ncbi:MAG: hypothetical protein IJU91_08140 [Selenomonadaceae bacterium]|nr:hypothetical protein [Selenomonadaceae bacterium]
MELTEQEAHCVARLLQGAIFGNEGALFNGCAFCKFQCGNKKSVGMYRRQIFFVPLINLFAGQM